MWSSQADTNITSHLVAMPFPGRGHINPLMNFCKLIAINQPNFLISFIITEEWLGFIGSDPKPANIHFSTVPNVIPSEIGRGKDVSGFFAAAQAKLEAPVEMLLERLEPPRPSVIIYDTFLGWVVALGGRKNIPVASFFTQSATVFSAFYYYDLIAQHGHVNVNLSERGDELIDYIPGVLPLRVADLPTPINGMERDVKAKFLLIASFYELEGGVVEALRKVLPIPIYLLGLGIHSSTMNNIFSRDEIQSEYIKHWLDSQRKESVLYVSQGSFLSTSGPQLQEIISGILNSGVRFFWVAREEASKFDNGSDKGLIVPWCDQLKVLNHPSIGGFWSHCGWSSTRECVFSGLPILTYPLIWDQVTNGKQLVEDWKIGLRVKKDDESLITRQEISKLVRKFMDLENDEGKEMRKRAKQLQGVCKGEFAEGSYSDVDSFIKDISSYNHDG